MKKLNLNVFLINSDLMLGTPEELNLLRLQHQEAIRKCDFVKAKDLNDQINRFNHQIKSGQTGTQLLGNKMEYKNVCDRVRSSASDEYSRAKQSIYETKIHFHDRLSALLSIHSEQLQNLGSDYAKAIEVCAIRTVKDADNWTNGAQIMASLHNYEAAQELYKLANSNKELTTLQRQEDCHYSFDRLQERLKQKHQEELALNSQKRYQRFVEIKQDYDRAIDRLKKVLSSAAIRLQIKQNPEEEAKFFKELIITPDDDELTDIPRTPLSPLSRLSSTSSPRSPSRGSRQTPRSPHSSQSSQSPNRYRASPQSTKSPKSPKSNKSGKSSSAASQQKSPKSQPTKVSYKLDSPASPTRK